MQHPSQRRCPLLSCLTYKTPPEEELWSQISFHLSHDVHSPLGPRLSQRPPPQPCLWYLVIRQKVPPRTVDYLYEIQMYEVLHLEATGDSFSRTWIWKCDWKERMWHNKQDKPENVGVLDAIKDLADVNMAACLRWTGPSEPVQTCVKLYIWICSYFICFSIWDDIID